MSEEERQILSDLIDEVSKLVGRIKRLEDQAERMQKSLAWKRDIPINGGY